jgi:prepilin-type N-terminal cleavage/methylation domain-containing protein
MRKFSIFKFQFSQGFTLIEILTVISILAVIGSITVAVITVTLRTTKKSDLIEAARNDSDTALTQMVKSIRYAASLDNPASCVPSKTVASITFTSVTTHLQTTYDCNAGTIKSNGTSLFNTNAFQVTSCSFVCTQPTLNDPPTITIQYTLQPASGGFFAETNFSLPFESSVTMRNLSQ